MAQQFLDGAQVRAVGQEIGGECVSQCVWVNRGIAHYISRIELHNVACPPIGEAMAAMIQEEGLPFLRRRTNFHISIEGRGSL